MAGLCAGLRKQMWLNLVMFPLSRASQSGSQWQGHSLPGGNLGRLRGGGGVIAVTHPPHPLPLCIHPGDGTNHTQAYGVAIVFRDPGASGLPLDLNPTLVLLMRPWARHFNAQYVSF